MNEGCVAPTREVLIWSVIFILILFSVITIWLNLITDSVWTLWAVARASKETSLKVISFRLKDLRGSSFSAHSNNLSEFHIVSYLAFDGLFLKTPLKNLLITSFPFGSIVFINFIAERSEFRVPYDAPWWKRLDKYFNSVLTLAASGSSWLLLQYIHQFFRAELYCLTVELVSEAIKNSKASCGSCFRWYACRIASRQPGKAGCWVDDSTTCKGAEVN